jgi:hypothetical protein
LSHLGVANAIRVRGKRCGAMQMRRAAVLLVALALGGCLPEPGKDIAACETQAGRFYQTYKAVDPNDPSSKYIIECMAAKGYDFTITPADCDSRHPLPTQPACYTPTNWLAGIADQIRRSLTAN